LNYLANLNDLLNVYKTHSKDLTKLFHIANKKIPYYYKGKIIQPDKANGYKFELFVNGFIPYVTEKTIFYQVVREEEFAPVKNEKGNPVDSPDTALKMISELHRKWIEKNGGILDGEGILEIDELLSYEGENLEKIKGKTIKLPIYLTKI